MSQRAVQYRDGGVWLPSLALWLDPPRAQTGPERVVVSHAHADHTARHREVIVSEPTARLMQARLGGERQEHVLPFGERREFAGPHSPYAITLLPAGHIFGSAMAFVEFGGQSLLYTGDFKLRPSRSAEPCDPSHAHGCDVLIMETTFGRPEYAFPPAAAVFEEVRRFCRQALNEGETPVLLGYSLGKSQEVLSGLAATGLPIMLHPAVGKLTRIYEQLGQRFPPYESFNADTARGKVLICPPRVARSELLRDLGPRRLAVMTGWATDPRCRYRYGVDAAFPLSDHADFLELIEFVRLVAPRQVLTLHGFAADFAHSVRDLGLDAWALSEDEQLRLSLNLKASLPAVRKSRRAPTVRRSDDAFNPAISGPESQISFPFD